MKTVRVAINKNKKMNINEYNTCKSNYQPRPQCRMISSVSTKERVTSIAERPLVKPSLLKLAGE